MPRLQADASANLLMNTGSAGYIDQVRMADVFGGDPVVVMVQPKPGQQFLTADHMVGLAQLEGNLARAHGVRRVYGVGSLVNTFAGEVTRRALDLCGTEGQDAEKQASAAAKAAGKPSDQQTSAGQQAFDSAVQACSQLLAQKYPTLSVPALNNPSFYGELLLQPDGKVRPYWRSVFPDPNHALVSVRMDRDASLADVEHVISIARTASRGSGSKDLVTSAGTHVNVPTTAGNLKGLTFTLSGTPVLAAELAQSVRSSLTYLLPVSLIAMLLVAGLLLRVPYWWLAAPLAGLGVLWTAGAAAWLGLPLTPATLAVLPVVLGLSTDYL
ncbi:MAG: hypothetical protein J2P45_25940, partial [Candidatus Dormibacteraeota bacterium]|nr:hypothetical protein [Candidatus Dormibacteraeota bacterium]